MATKGERHTYIGEFPNHLDYCTHVQYEDDIDMLTRCLFNVNMRLFGTSPEYRNLILQICDYIAHLAETKKIGYSQPFGWSGANAGLPLNIIAVKRNGHVEVMINPFIVQSSKETVMTNSNCGSLTLEHPIEVHRSVWIDIEYFDRNGQMVKEEKVGRDRGGFTIQHEIEHNKGVLIFGVGSLQGPEL